MVYQSSRREISGLAPEEQPLANNVQDAMKHETGSTFTRDMLTICSLLVGCRRYLPYSSSLSGSPSKLSPGPFFTFASLYGRHAPESNIHRSDRLSHMSGCQSVTD